MALWVSTLTLLLGQKLSVPEGALKNIQLKIHSPLGLPCGPVVKTCVHAKSLQLCPTLCNPIDCSLPGSSVQGILQAKKTGVGCHALLQGIFLT